MGLWDRITTMLAVNPQIEHERSLLLASPFGDFPDLNTQLANIRGQNTQPWRRASVSTALGVPANFRAVTLIATTTGSLSLNAFRNGAVLPPDDRPRIIVRPDPFRTPRDFFRDTAWNMATLGEAWWWIAKRGTDDEPLSLINVDPQKITVEDNPRDPLRPIITWSGTRMPRDDMRQITFVQLPGQLRGIGPLQLCGAAVSVGVEAQEWAANFFAEGGNPSLWIKKAGMLSGELDDTGMSEADYFLTQWMNKPHNEPRLTDESVDSVTPLEYNTQGAQMLDSRDYQNGDAARMFGVPGSLLEYNTPGSSLTYQNLEQEFTKFVRGCLLPYFLEPIEQHMSDLLTRSTVARFNVDALLRADLKTRFDAYSVGISSGVIDAEYAQKQEGIIPGDVETAAMPFAVPQAVPNVIPIAQARSTEFRCDGLLAIRGVMRECNRVLFVGQNRCPRCKKEYAVVAEPAMLPAAKSVPILQLRAKPVVVEPEPVQPDARDVLMDLLRSMAERPQPDVHIHTAPVNIAPTEVTYNPPDIVVRNEFSVPEPVVNVTNEVTLPPRVPVTKTMKRDKSGQITQIVEE